MPKNELVTNGEVVSASNPLPTTPGAGSTATDISDRADRDLGKVDIAQFDVALSADIDSIDVSKMTKGGVFTAHNGIVATATSVEIDCREHNAVSVECAVSAITSGKWVLTILGCAVSGNTYGICYAPKLDGTFFSQITPDLDANGNYTFHFVGLPNFIKILATRTIDGTLTCKTTLFNM